MKTVIFSDNSLWGCLNFRCPVIENYLEQGYRVVIVAPNDSFVSVAIPKDLIFQPVEMQRIGNNPIKDFKYMLCLLKIYKKYNPQFIFHYTIKPNIYGTFAAKFLGIRSVIMVTGLGYVFNSAGITSKVAQYLYRIALKLAHKVFFLNSDNYNLLKNEKSILLKGGEGIKIENFDFTPLVESEKIIFLMIARVLYDKGYLEFVEAAKANPNAEFQLIGATDSNPAAVPADIVENERSINYLGFMNKTKVFERIKQATCIILPSYHEGMSVTLTEAIAMGKPVICSDIAGCRETVDDGVNGYVVEVKNSAALSEACKKFVNLSFEEKQRMSKASRRKAFEQFRVNTVIEIYNEITR